LLNAEDYQASLEKLEKAGDAIENIHEKQVDDGQVKGALESASTTVQNLKQNSTSTIITK